MKSLIALGIANADQCVVVAPPLAAGYTATEAARAYDRGLAGRGAAVAGAGDGTASGAQRRPRRCRRRRDPTLAANLVVALTGGGHQ